MPPANRSANNEWLYFKWLTDDSACTVTITASSYTEGDYTIDDSIVLVGTLENNTLSFEFDQNDIETNVYIVEFVFATYKKWYAATFDEYGLDYSKWPKLTISLTK